jgi:hypothetical protein
MRRKLRLEQLENRCLMASIPFGAAAEDTGEFMLGRIAVTPVFIESSGNLDLSTEDWNPAHRAEVLNKIEAGLDWWVDLLATKSSKHELEFVIDRTFADVPFESQYEPINRRSNDYTLWVSEFLVDRGFQQSVSLETNMRAFNHAQRLKLQTDWSFTIFVVNSQNDVEGTFAPGGSFSRAFSFAGGLFQVVPSTRPTSTFTHETGHMFWARDEYLGSGNYYQRRGYYNAQNTNAIDLNPDPLFVQADSIMADGLSLQRAFDFLVSPDATLAQLGWVDSDGDEIFDVLDVPLGLRGVGRLDPVRGEYLFQGEAHAQALPNLNSVGRQNNITLNRVERIEYRINAGAWTTFVSPNAYEVNLDLKIPIPSGTQGTIEVRAIDTRLGIVSDVFVGSLSPAWSTTESSGVYGFAWNDLNQDGVWQAMEPGIAGATVRLENEAGQPIRTQSIIRPSALPEGQVINPVSGTTLSSIGMDADGRVGVFPDADGVLDTRVFRPYSWSQQNYRESFRGTDSQLKVAFAQPTSYVFVHTIAAEPGAIARLDAFDSNGKILARAESPELALDVGHGLEVEADGAKIAYVVAYGHRETAIKIDQVRHGYSAEAVTDAWGAYQFPLVASSNVVVRITPPSTAYGTTVPAGGSQTRNVPSPSSSVRADFGLFLLVSPWQNQVRREDVDNDGLITLFDVLIVINEINRNGARELTANDASPPPFIDVDGNRIVEALDVLIVINYINAQGGSGEGESEWVGLDQDQVRFDNRLGFDPFEYQLRRRRSG